MRQDEIEKAGVHIISTEVHDLTWADGFETGAKWADKTMLIKAREWVKNAFIGPFGEGLANSIADEFVKAMKL